MFRALHTHHQEVNCIDAAPGIILSVIGRPVHRLRENCGTISPLQSSTCFEHYMLIIRMLIALMLHLVSSSQSVAANAHVVRELQHNTSTTILYMFRGYHAHHQEVNCIDEASGIVLSVSGRTMHMLRENCGTIRPLQSSTCIEDYMLIIRRLIALMQHLVSSSQLEAVQCIC